MRKTIIFISLILAAFFTGCFESSPKTAVEKFYKAAEKNDTNAMAEVATQETMLFMGMFGSKAQGMIAANKIKTLTEKIDGDKAVVTATFEDGSTDNIDLKKINGKWKVHIDMNDKKNSGK